MNTEICDLVSNLVFVAAFFKALAEKLVAKGGYMEDLRRLVEEPDLQWQIVSLIIYPGLKHVLGEHEYRVHVIRSSDREKPMPAFYGTDFQRHEITSFVEGNDAADEVIMVAKKFTKEEFDNMDGYRGQNIIAWGRKYGLEPADQGEVYSFGCGLGTQNFLKEREIVGLGSACGIWVPALNKRRFTVDCFNEKWRADRWYLFVRKSSLPALSP